MHNEQFFALSAQTKVVGSISRMKTTLDLWDRTKSLDARTRDMLLELVDAAEMKLNQSILQAVQSHNITLLVRTERACYEVARLLNKASSKVSPETAVPVIREIPEVVSQL